MVNLTNLQPDLDGESAKSNATSEQIGLAQPIAKPSTFNLEKFKSKRAAAVANVETLQTALPTGAGTVKKLFSLIAKRTCACRCSCCARNCNGTAINVDTLCCPLPMSSRSYGGRTIAPKPSP